MADDKDLGFKISDHRKFNPDGTLRGRSDEDSDGAGPVSEGGAPEESVVESAAGHAADASKVLPFPGEGHKRDEQAAPSESPGTRQQNLGAASTPTAAGDPFFDELVNMLTVEAVMHLGLIENPGGAEITVDLEAARHMIDMLGMLQNKTRGNLTPDESLLIDNVLADLRMQFVAISRAT
jgi:hypothetical protein